MNIKASNYSKPRGKQIKKIMLAVKSFIGAISIGSYFNDHPQLGFWLLVAGAGIDEASKFIDVDEVSDTASAD